MTHPSNPNERSPKGDHNRRLSLGVDASSFARLAGVTVEQLNGYERTSPDHDFDLVVADKVGAALEVMEAVKEPLVDNGPRPEPDHDVAGRRRDQSDG